MTVEGYDNNPNCVDGSERNLQHMFGEAEQQNYSIDVADSTIRLRNSQKRYDCVVSNLPWGQNTVDYLNENTEIVRAVRTTLDIGVPCAYIARDERICDVLEETGYEILGLAAIPQRNFHRPKQKAPANTSCCVAIASTR